MGVWNRPREEHLGDVQLPPYSEHWQYVDGVKILEPADMKEPHLLGCGPSSADHASRSPAESKVSPYYDSELRRHCSTTNPEKGDLAVTNQSKSISFLHRHLRSKASTHSYHLTQSSWIRSLKKKHRQKHSKPSASNLTPIPAPKFTAIPIPIHPPKLLNRIILSQDTITLSKPTGRNCSAPSPFKITLETTLLENRPYTICSPVLQRSQSQNQNQNQNQSPNLDSALSHFEIVDIETGRVLSAPPPATPREPTTTPASRSIVRKHLQARKPPHPGIPRTNCTHLHPHTPSTLSHISYPTPAESSTERLFSALRIRDPTLLIGRRLRVRLRPAVALWIGRRAGDVFGDGAWPDIYGWPLVLGAEEEGGGVGGEFRVVG